MTFLLDLLTRDADESVDGLEPLELPPDEAPFDDPFVGAIWTCARSWIGWWLEVKMHRE